MNARYCAWCGTVIRARHGRTGPPGRLSHGICASCLVDTGEFPVVDLQVSDERYPPLGVLRIDSEERVREYRAEPAAGFPTSEPDAYVGLRLADLARVFSLRSDRLVAADGASPIQEIVFRYPEGAALIEIQAYARPAEAATFMVWRIVQ